MVEAIREVFWNQFGASIDMLRNAIAMQPNQYWETDKRFFYISYHVVLFFDYNLTLPPDGFTSPLPYDLVELSQIPEDALDDLVPKRIYSKDEILHYLSDTRERCRQFIYGLTEEKLAERWIESSRNYSVMEILLYNMRHVQHHAAQLNLLLRQRLNKAPGWASKAE
jgi:hypothetical protein